MCVSMWAVPRFYAVFNQTVPAVGGYFSYVIYLWVVYAYRKHIKQVVVANKDVNSQKLQLNRQRKLTVTLGIVTLFTFFAHSIPYTIVTLMGLCSILDTTSLQQLFLC